MQNPIDLKGFIREALSTEGAVPAAALAICSILRRHFASSAVRFWLYNQAFNELDLLAQDCAEAYRPIFSGQKNQLPVKSLAGNAFQSGEVTQTLQPAENGGFSSTEQSLSLFSALPSLTCIPVISLESGRVPGQWPGTVGVLDVHMPNGISLAPVDDDLIFIGSIAATVLAQAHSSERKRAVAELNRLASDLVAPSTTTSFTDRKENYFQLLKKTVLEFLYANCLSIFIANETLDTIRCCASTGISGQADLRKVVYHAGEGVTWHVFETNTPLNCRDVRRDCVEYYKRKYHEIRTINPTDDSDPFLAVPLPGQNHATGVIRVLERRCHVNSRALQNFSQHDLDTLNVISAQVSPVFRLLALQEHSELYIMRTAHQVIQPLTGIIAYASNIIDGDYGAIEKDSPLERRLRYVRAMSNAAARTMRSSQWVAELTDFGFLRSQKRFEMDLTQYLINRVIDMQPLREDQRITVKFLNPDETDSLGYFWADDLYFGPVVQNILHNAVKYSYPNTTVEVCAHRNNDELLIDVSSTGVPIVEAERERIFWDRERGKYAKQYDPIGTGQGLSICSQIMRGFGGSVELLSSIPAPNVHISRPNMPPAATNTFRITLAKAFR